MEVLIIATAWCAQEMSSQARLTRTRVNHGLHLLQALHTKVLNAGAATHGVREPVGDVPKQQQSLLLHAHTNVKATRANRTLSTSLVHTRTRCTLSNTQKAQSWRGMNTKGGGGRAGAYVPSSVLS
jgi:hypothetical protein